MSLKEKKAEIKVKQESLAKVFAEAKVGSGDELRYDHTKVKEHEFESGAHMIEWIDGTEKALKELNDEITGRGKGASRRRAEPCCRGRRH